MRRLLALAVLALVVVPARRGDAWNTAEHIRICQELPLPPQFQTVMRGGFTVPEWCALPDYERSVGGILTDGMCSGDHNWTDAWWVEYLAAGPCGVIWAYNNSHFGSFAYSHWFYYHSLALLAAQHYAERCTPGCFSAAAALEGFGLHYLTDAFASGHAWNPLGDYETDASREVQFNSSTGTLPNLAFPPPDGINVFRQGIHDWLNSATADGAVPPIEFADAFAGVPVIGDKLLPDDLTTDEQAGWALSRARAAMLDVWWAVLGVRGQGGCVVTNVCTPDAQLPQGERGDEFRCIPFVSNQAWDQALAALGANAAALADYGTCASFDPSGHDCAWAHPLASWPGSLDTEIDTIGAIARLGCNLGDMQVYEGGQCAANRGAADVRASVCDVYAAGDCDFTGDCDLPWGGAVGPDGGVPDAGPSADGAAPRADASGGAGDGGPGGCGCRAAGGLVGTPLVVLALLVLALDRSRRSRS